MGTSIAVERRLVVVEPISANYELLVFGNQLKTVKKAGLEILVVVVGSERLARDLPHVNTADRRTYKRNNFQVDATTGRSC